MCSRGVYRGWRCARGSVVLSPESLGPLSHPLHQRGPRLPYGPTVGAYEHTEGGDVLVVPGVAIRDRRAVPDPRNLGRRDNVLARRVVVINTQ